MSSLIPALGVDYRQWKAVSLALLRSDFRAPLPVFPAQAPARSPRGLVFMALIFGGFSLSVVLVIATNPDVRFTGALTLGYLAFTLTTALLSQHGATLLSPTDLAILGSRPVTSRTIFAIRLTNLLIHVLLATTLLGWGPIAAFTLAHGVSAPRGVAAAMAIYAWALTLTFAIVAVYALALRRAGPIRLSRFVGYLQFATGTAGYGGWFAVMVTQPGAVWPAASLPASSWVLWLPPMWFISALEIATGHATLSAWVRVVLATATLLSLAALLRGRLATHYASDLVATTGEAMNRRRRLWQIAAPHARSERRAVMMLALSHIRRDLRLRMGLLSAAPLLLLYALLVIRDPAPADPFAGARPDSAVNLLGMAALIFPITVVRHLERSDAYRAAWIFGVSPADPNRLTLALKNVAARWFLLPFVLLLAGLFAIRFGHVGHALVHASALGVLAHLALQCAVLLRPRLPFSEPPDKNVAGAELIGWLMAVLVGGQLVLVGLQRFAYASWTGVLVSIALAITASLLLEQRLRRARQPHPRLD